MIQIFLVFYKRSKASNIKNILPLLYSLPLLFLSSYFMVRVSGKYSFVYFFMFSFFLFICFFNKRLFYFFILPIILIYSLYAPFGFQYKIINYDYLVSIFFTNTSEVTENLQLIPYKYYLYSLLIPISLILFIFVGKPFSKLTIKINKILFYILFISGFLASPFLKVALENCSSLFYLNKELKEVTNIYNEWGDASFSDDSDDIYVVIIGESARKDYHNAYGYPLKNSPFMTKSNGILVNGFTTAGINTVNTN